MRIFNKECLNGSFTVELAIVAVVFALALAFCGDTVIKISMKGKLDRMSFSAVNIIKERTVLFGQDDYDVSQETFNKVEQIISSSMKRMQGNFDADRFAMAIDVWTEADGAKRIKDSRFDTACSVPAALKQSQTVLTSWGRYASLYRVTMCYRTDNWFGALVDRKYERVQSSSMMIAR